MIKIQSSELLHRDKGLTAVYAEALCGFDITIIQNIKVKNRNYALLYGRFRSGLNLPLSCFEQLMDSKDIVRRGYDKVSYAYRENENNAVYPSDYGEWLTQLTRLLPAKLKILELGCGCGVPVAQILSEDFSVTGVDISLVQIERARNLVPGVEFICADMIEIDFPAESFAAIVSLYAIIHIPLDEQSALFAKLFEWLRPGGYLLATVGSRAWTGVEENWLDVSGATMFWSHADAETYHDWLADTGFELCWSKFIPEGIGGHQLVLARKQSK